jgi:hypothetical protein
VDDVHNLKAREGAFKIMSWAFWLRASTQGPKKVGGSIRRGEAEGRTPSSRTKSVGTVFDGGRKFYGALSMPRWRAMSVMICGGGIFL